MCNSLSRSWPKSDHSSCQARAGSLATLKRKPEARSNVPTSAFLYTSLHMHNFNIHIHVHTIYLSRLLLFEVLQQAWNQAVLVDLLSWLVLNGIRTEARKRHLLLQQDLQNLWRVAACAGLRASCWIPSLPFRSRLGAGGPWRGSHQERLVLPAELAGLSGAERSEKMKRLAEVSGKPPGESPESEM